MPLALSLGALAAGLSWAVWAGFSESVTGTAKRPGPIEPLHVASRPILASFLAGLGGSGLTLHVWGAVSGSRTAWLAVVSGLLIAFLVRSVVSLASDQRAEMRTSTSAAGEAAVLSKERESR
jgi:hypothetical protein